MVVRRKGEADARSKVVEITDDGRAAVKEIAKVRVELATDLFKGLNKSEIRAMTETLSEVLDDGKQ